MNGKYTMKKSAGSFPRAMSMNFDKAWLDLPWRVEANSWNVDLSKILVGSSGWLLKSSLWFNPINAVARN